MKPISEKYFENEINRYILSTPFIVIAGVIPLIMTYLKGYITNTIFIPHIVGISLSFIIYIFIIIIYKTKILNSMAFYPNLYNNGYHYIQIGLVIFIILSIFSYGYIYVTDRSKIIASFGVLIYDLLIYMFNLFYIMISPPKREDEDPELEQVQVAG